MTAVPPPPTNGTEPCADGDPDRFFPDDGQNGRYVEVVKEECRRGCHVLDACLAFSLTHKVAGIWAATTPKEREALRKARGIKAEPLSFGVLVSSPPPIAAASGHGSWSGINYHRNRYEKPCDDCRAFASKDARQRRKAKLAEVEAAS